MVVHFARLRTAGYSEQHHQNRDRFAPFNVPFAGMFYLHNGERTTIAKGGTVLPK